MSLPHSWGHKAASLRWCLEKPLGAWLQRGLPLKFVTLDDLISVWCPVSGLLQPTVLSSDCQLGEAVTLAPWMEGPAPSDRRDFSTSYLAIQAPGARVGLK